MPAQPGEGGAGLPVLTHSVLYYSASQRTAVRSALVAVWAAFLLPPSASHALPREHPHLLSEKQVDLQEAQNLTQLFQPFFVIYFDLLNFLEEVACILIYFTIL